MAELHRAAHKLPPTVVGEEDDFLLDNSGFLWLLDKGVWVCQSCLLKYEGVVIDVLKGPPSSSNRGDVAITKDSHWWFNDGHEWIYQYQIVGSSLTSIECEGLIVRGNLRLPIVAGYVPLYDAKARRIIGKIRVEPIKK